MTTFRDTQRQQKTDETDGRTVTRIWFSNCWRTFFLSFSRRFDSVDWQLVVLCIASGLLGVAISRLVGFYEIVSYLIDSCSNH